jgi:hypothetical protein
MLTIPAALVGYLRRGLLRELDAAADLLRFELERDPIEAKTYRQAFASIITAGKLLELIGVTDDAAQQDAELDLSGSAAMILRALQAQYDVEIIRLQDAESSGLMPPLRDIPALGDCIVAVKQEIDARADVDRGPSRCDESRGLR